MKPKNYSNPIKNKTNELGDQFILDIPYDQI